MSATSSFSRAVKKAKSLYKSGRYAKFSDAVKAAYKKNTVGRKKASPLKGKPHKKWGVVKKHERRVSVIGKVSTASLKSELRDRLKDRLGKKLVAESMATTKRERKKNAAEARAIRTEIKKMC